MSLLLSTRRAVVLGVESYMDKVLSTGPIAYWPLNETSASTAINYGTLGTAANGTATGVTWASDASGPFGTPAPFFDGANDYVRIRTAALDAAFNGATGSYLLWFKVANAGVWTDGGDRFAIHLYMDANNYYGGYKAALAQRWGASFKAGGGGNFYFTDGLSDVGWIPVLSTWSDQNNSDEFSSYYDGVQSGPSAALDAWAGGGFNNAYTNIGAYCTGPLAKLWHGWIAHLAIWDRVLTQAEITALEDP